VAETSPEIGSFVIANGVRTNYLDAGRGDCVVLIHGSGPGVTAYANWRLVIPRLAERFRVVAPDVVGFGYTDRPNDATYKLSYWTAHLVGFLEALGIERAHFVGNSFGGALSLALAASRPDLVDRLVLMGSVGVDFPLTPGLDAVWGYRPSLEAMRELLHLFAYDRSRVTPDLVEARYSASIRPGYQECFEQMFPAPRQRCIADLQTPKSEIGKLRHQALIIHGRDDRVIPLTTSLELHSLIDDSQLHVFGRCGHWVQIEQNERFCRLVGDFLAAE